MWLLNGNCYTCSGYLHLHYGFYNPPFCLQSKDRLHTETCCLMMLTAYNLWQTSDTAIPQTKLAQHCQVQTAFPVTLPHKGYWNQVKLHTKQCKKSLQHKLDVPSVGLLSSAQRNLILPHFHQVKSCTSKSTHIISHKPSNTLYKNSDSEDSDYETCGPLWNHYMYCGGHVYCKENCCLHLQGRHSSTLKMEAAGSSKYL